MSGAQIVATSGALEALCERVAASPRVGIDTEFHNERSYTARLMAVQLAFDDGAAIVDPLVPLDLAPLAEALRQTLVVGHALASDMKIFADRYGVVPPRVYDCQIAASFLGYGMAISLADLVRDLTGVRLKKSQTVSDWSRRPFSQQQVEYLVDDVAHLLPMHDLLDARLRETGRSEWAAQEMEPLSDIERYRVDERRLYMRIPGANRMNRRELGVLLEVAALRDRAARERDLPLKYILPDDVVAGIATLRPKRIEDFAQLRRMDAGARRSFGPALLEAVARGERKPEEQLPHKPSKPLGNSREALVAVMNVAVAEIARRNELPSSLLAPRAALERVAREAPRDRASFEATLDLSDWRTKILGEPLWRLLSGETALRIEGYATGDPRISTTL